MNGLDTLAGNEAQLRLLFFGGALVLLLALERLFPLRRDSGLRPRQGHNLAFMLLNTAVLRLAFPVLAVAWAVSLQDQGVGLLAWLDWPRAVSIVLTVLLLDLAIYWQHRLLHTVPLLWRMHRVHHSDIAFDVTTVLRFHPLEIVLSMGIKLGLIALLGADPLGVLAFEILLSLGSLFTHTDIALPKRLDRAVRYVLVTPSMHRIHHSVIRAETDSNFGFHLSVWDRLFGSYRAAPIGDEADMPIGLEQFRDRQDQTLWALLRQPFRSGKNHA